MARQERLQKIMAHAGLGSRRACEELIRQGRVTVNGQRAHLGQKADPERDQIALDGRPVGPKADRVYVALYKPPGVVSTVHDRHGRPTVLDLVPPARQRRSERGYRLYPVGRLDMESEGLILLTNDGALTLVLTHPRYEHDKVYEVLVAGHPAPQTLQQWRQGVLLEGHRTAPAQVSVLRRGRAGTWLRVVMHEGRKRQIRRVGELLGHDVQRVIRVQLGPLRLGGLEPGAWRYLSEEEVAALEGIKKGA